VTTIDPDKLRVGMRIEFRPYNTLGPHQSGQGWASTGPAETGVIVGFTRAFVRVRMDRNGSLRRVSRRRIRAVIIP